MITDKPPEIPKITDGDRRRDFREESSSSEISLTPTEDEDKNSKNESETSSSEEVNDKKS